MKNLFENWQAGWDRLIELNTRLGEPAVRSAEALAETTERNVETFARIGNDSATVWSDTAKSTVDFWSEQSRACYPRTAAQFDDAFGKERGR